MIGGAALAALLSASVAAAAQPIRFDRISVEQGLSQVTVLAILQDSRGYIWVGTEDGLNRYDGYGFTVFKHDPLDASTLANDMVWAIEEDAAGDLWIGTEGGGLVKWERASERFVAVVPADEGTRFASDYIRSLRFDRQGRLWIGTRESGLDRFDPATGTIEHFRHSEADPSSLSDDRVYALFVDRAGELWVGTDVGLNRFDPATGGFVRYQGGGLADPRVRAVYEGRGDSLWVGTYAGLHRLDPSSGRFERFPHDPEDAAGLGHDRVRAIVEDAAGRLWLGTGEGLELFDAERGRFAHYRHDPANPTSLSEDSVMTLLVDDGGVMWVGTRTGGLNKWNPLSWQFGHRTADHGGLSSANVTAFAEDPAGNVWIGTFGGGLNRMDRTSGAMAHFRHDPRHAGGLSSDRVMALQVDRQAALWIGTFDGGLNRLDTATGSFKIFRHHPDRPASLAKDGVMSLLVDSRGVLWVGTFGGGLDRFDSESETFTHFRPETSDPTSLSGDRVTVLAEDPSGALWVGTDGAGLNRFDRRTETFERFRHDPADPASLTADTIFALGVDASGTVWVGTRGGGLNKVEVGADGKVAFKHFSERDGLANDVVYGIRGDAAGHLWLSTNNGLSRFERATGKFKNYNVSHGLQAKEFNFGASFKSASGELFFGGINGFNSFFPDRLRSNPHSPPVVLTALLKLNQPDAEAGPPDRLSAVELGHRDDVVTFEFAALDFTAQEMNRYAYQLEGFDRDWVDLGPLHRVTYTNLDPGRYVFRVRAANNDGVWSSESLALPVTVVPPPWRTLWAYLVYALLAAGLVVGYLRVQRAKLEREAEYSRRLEQEVRERTAELETHAQDLERLNQQLVEASLTDSLTGLANRRFLFEYIDKEIALVQRHYTELAAGAVTPEAFDLMFMMVDLDDFKAINDTCGHVAGDQVLTQVRKILEEACRSSDILIRWGGDEFLVVARDSTADGLEVLAERVRARIEAHAFVLGDGQVVRTTCSIGFACYPFLRQHLDALSWEQVIGVADRALYVAKNSGRNAWVGFLSTEKTPVKGLLAALRDQPARLADRGELEIRTSVEESIRLVSA